LEKLSIRHLVADLHWEELVKAPYLTYACEDSMGRFSGMKGAYWDIQLAVYADVSKVAK